MLSFLSFCLVFYSNYEFFCLIYDICDNLVMGHVFKDIFPIINFSFMQLKYYHIHHLQKDELQNGSFPYDIGVLMLEGLWYTFLGLTNFYFT